VAPLRVTQRVLGIVTSRDATQTLESGPHFLQ
jgi:hypothetical protein